MEKIAVFPGSFDPITIGHEDIVERAFSLFDKIIIAVGINTNKQGGFPLEMRLEWIREVFGNDERVIVDHYTQLTVEYCRKLGAKYILRGLRTAADFEYERAIAQANKAMDAEIETVFLLTAPEHAHVNSSIVRDILLHNADASMFLPKRLDISKYNLSLNN
jgi:pantetheine-phosphate adenylyltransferase